MWLQKIIRTFVQYARQNKGDVKKHCTVPKKIKRKNQLPYHLSQQYLMYLAKNYTGKYLIRNEIDLEENVFQYLLKSKHFVATPSIIFTLLYQPRCGRCNN